MTTHTLHLTRKITAPAERIYRAFLDPDAVVKWMPPHGFTGKVHELDARVGGRYRMSFTQFANGKQIDFGGEYHELVPGEKIRHSDRFDDPALAGEMITTVTFQVVDGRTVLEIVQEGIPEALAPEACETGWQESLSLLARLVEADIPG